MFGHNLRRWLTINCSPCRYLGWCRWISWYFGRGLTTWNRYSLQFFFFSTLLSIIFIDELTLIFVLIPSRVRSGLVLTTLSYIHQLAFSSREISLDNRLMPSNLSLWMVGLKWFRLCFTHGKLGKFACLPEKELLWTSLIKLNWIIEAVVLILTNFDDLRHSLCISINKQCILCFQWLIIIQ